MESIIVDVLGKSLIVGILLIILYFAYRYFSEQLEKKNDIIMQQLAAKDLMINKKDDQLEKAAERIMKYSELLKDVSTMLTTLNSESAKHSESILNQITRIKEQVDQMDRGVNDILSEIKNVLRK